MPLKDILVYHEGRLCGDGRYPKKLPKEWKLFFKVHVCVKDSRGETSPLILVDYARFVENKKWAEAQPIDATFWGLSYFHWGYTGFISKFP